jgi:hypothetical protein
LPGGSVQADVVFGEEVPDPPVAVPVPAADGGCVSTWAASAAQSLAWKLLWLDTDMHPQGKDLYDAVLLAERSRLSRELLERTFAAAGQVGLPETAGDMVRRWPVDWDNFVLESPWVAGTAAEWRERLIEALEPTFAGVSGDTVGNPLQSVAFDPRWRTADVLGLARGITEEKAFDRLPLLADALMDAGCADEQVLGHCSSEGPHVRGCWVVDLVIGNE